MAKASQEILDEIRGEIDAGLGISFGGFLPLAFATKAYTVGYNSIVKSVEREDWREQDRQKELINRGWY